jgi:hypothetical protein
MNQMILFLKTHELLINFFCHAIIFLGGFYIAIHSRKIATWLRTCLWYIGCSSFLITISVIIEWALGPDIEFSFTNTQLLSRNLLYFWIAVTTFVFFIKTVMIDIKHFNNRQQDD